MVGLRGRHCSQEKNAGFIFHNVAPLHFIGSTSKTVYMASRSVRPPSV